MCHLGTAEAVLGQVPERAEPEQLGLKLELAADEAATHLVAVPFPVPWFAVPESWDGRRGCSKDRRVAVWD